jgi:hypothetical protein
LLAQWPVAPLRWEVLVLLGQRPGAARLP